MYTVGVREHVMIAHSFRGKVFGPARELHGATYVVDVELRSTEITSHGIVVDIAAAKDALVRVLKTINFKNLDDLPVFHGQNTTTEFLARHLFDAMSKEICDGALGAGSDEVSSIKVTLHESHVAWASYEGSISNRSKKR